MKTRNRSGRLAVLLIAAAGAACESPAQSDTPRIEAAWLLDRVDGVAPPAPICEQGSSDQFLLYESIALSDDDSYGRLQQTRIEDGPVLEQAERGTFERTDSAILLINAEEDTLVLIPLDDDEEYVRRIHTCGDTLRYREVEVR